MNIYILFLFLVIGSAQASIRQAFKAYQAGNYAQAQEKIESLQVDDPDNAQLNYNAGLAYYKQGAYDNAQSSFKRAMSSTQVLPQIKSQSQFNLGNSYYKQAVDMLGSGWQQKKIDASRLEKSLKLASLSLESYRHILDHDKSDEYAQKNQEHAHQLYEKIKQKKEQQDNQEKQEKDSQDKSDEQKDEQSNSEKDSSKNKDTSNSEQKQDSEEQSEQSESKQDSSQQQDSAQEDDAKKQNKESQNQSESQKSDQAQTENDSQDKSQDGHAQDSDDDESLDQKQSIKDDKKDGKEEFSQGQVGESAQDHGVEQDMEMRAVKAVLDNLSKKEENLQKALIRLKTQGNQPRPGQHNW